VRGHRGESERMRAQREKCLLALEHEKKSDTRAEAANTLCELADEANDKTEFVADVAVLIADPQPEVRSAGLALASTVLKAEEAEGLLARHLSDPNARVRCEAAGRLADLALPSSRGALAAALQDRSAAVRFEAARGMAGLKHAAGFDVLIAALEDNELRFRALSALAILADPRALPHVKAIFSRFLINAFDRTQAAGVLALLGDPDGEKHLLARAAKKWTPDRPMALELLGEVKAKEALPTLSRILENRKDTCRGSAARALGRLKSAEARAVLERAKTTADEELKVDIDEGLQLLDS
jgi:HEAT repeat protein